MSLPLHDLGIGKDCGGWAVTATNKADQDREKAIQQAGREIEAFMERGDRALASEAQERMFALIRERSSAQVARMEAERGLV